MVILRAIVALGATVLLAVQACHAGPVSSDFASGSEGWTNISLNWPYNNPPSISGTYGVDWTAAEGGYIYRLDPDALASYFSAPGKFLGDQSDAYGLELRFDFRPDAMAELNPGPHVILTGGGGTLYRDVEPPTGSVWTTRQVALLATNDWHFNSEFGPAPSESDFRSVLANLTGVYIYADWISGYETESLDNVILGVDSSIPEPATALALLAGLPGLARYVHSRRKRKHCGS